MIYSNLKQNIETFKAQILSCDLNDPAFSVLADEWISEIVNLSKEFHWNNFEEPLAKFKAKRFSFEWMDSFKQCCILLRDMQLLAIKNLISIEDRNISFVTAQEYENKSFELLEIALSELEHDLDDINNCSDIDQVKENEWYHSLSPLPIFLSQAKEIQKQLKAIISARHDLYIVGNDVKLNKQDIYQLLNHHTKSVQWVIDKSQKLLSKIHACNETIDAKEIVSLLKELNTFYSDLQVSKIKTTTGNTYFKTLGKRKIPVSREEGVLVYKEIDFKHHINQWLEEEIYPSLLDIQRLDEIIHEKAITTILNTRNRVELLKIEELEKEPIPKSMLSAPVLKLLDQASTLQEEIEQHTTNVSRLINEEYSVSKIFDSDRLFLKQSMDFSLVDYENSSKSILKYFNLNNIKNRFKRISSKYFHELNLHSKTNIDLIEYIKDNKLPKLDQFSQSLFLKKGYIGSSFNVPRKRFNELIKFNYNHWKEGFNGCLLVYGHRLSGRTALLESVEHLIPSTKTIALSPNKEIIYKGRKFFTGYDLLGTLKFIYKYTQTKKVVLTIDDLEQWRSSKHSVYSNAKQFLDVYNKYSRKILFVISTNHHIKQILDTQLAFSSYFTSTFNADRMLKEEVVQCLLIRHSASLRENNENLEDLVLDEDKLRHKAKQIAQFSGLNIGNSLKTWSRYFYKDDHERKLTKIPIVFSNLIIRNKLILTHLLRYRKTNEEEVNKMIGSKYTQEITDDIQNLYRYKILDRTDDGSIYINESLVYQIESIILKEYIKPNTLSDA